MIYNRGTIDSFQRWASDVGDESWTFQNLLPYFSRGIKFSEPIVQFRAANATLPPPANPLAVNASGGPLQVSYPNFALPFSSYVQLAMREAGIPEQQDFMSGHLLGSQYAPGTISSPEEERSSSEASYLRSALRSGRTNLKVYTHTPAKKVHFSANNTATSVEVTSKSDGNGATFFLEARREIVSSAGAFHSPQLLMVSGIGPRSQLEAHNISVIADRPGVGQNMWDHLVSCSRYKTSALQCIKLALLLRCS